MKLYLSSKGLGNNESFLKEWISYHNNKVLLIINALDSKDEVKRNNSITSNIEELEQLGFKIDILDLKKYFNNQDELYRLCKNYNIFYVVGGNVFVLREAMKYSGFDNYLTSIKNDDNVLYIGYSAGSIVLSSNIGLFNKVDDPINIYGKDEIINEGLGFINYLFIPHYKSDYHKSYLIDDVVEICKNKNISYKTFKDDESIIEDVV